MQKLANKGQNVKIITAEQEDQSQLEMAKKMEILQQQLMTGGDLLDAKAKEAAAEKRAL